MYRQIIIPEKASLLLKLPRNFVGKVVEVLAFRVKDGFPKSDMRKLGNERYDQSERLEKLMKFISKNPINLPTGYNFNREELYD